MSRAMVLEHPAPASSAPLRMVERALPRAGVRELLVAVEACGVCRTDLHVVEGDLPPQRPAIVPGHEVVGRVAEVGDGVAGVNVGDRVGIAWLHASCGGCRFCLLGRENLCLAPTFTGWHTEELPLDRANEALRRLKDDEVEGAAVLRVAAG
jgi:alcohol dehydrogenase, propanol-preferring